MHPVHTVILLSVNIVTLTYVGPLRWVFRALAVVCAVLVSRTSSSRHLRAVKTRGVGYLISRGSVLVRVSTLALVLQLVLWIVISSACVLRCHSVAVTPLSMVLLI